MRRVLLVAYYTPPRKGVATARTSALAHYLPAYGWQPTILTAPLEYADARTLQTPYLDLARSLKRAVGIGERSTHALLHTAPAERGARRTLRQRAIAFGFGLTSYPDAQVGWLAGTRALRAVLADASFDAVISSSPPYTATLMLALARTRIPWIADFRDLWAENDLRATPLVRAFDDPLERWALRRARALTTVSEPLAERLRKRYPARRVESIPNAFDPREWEGIPFDGERACTLLYAGQLYLGRRDPRPLLRVVRALLDDGSVESEELRVELYAPAEPWLHELIASFALEGVVRVHGMVARDDVLRAERRADRLVVLLWDGANTEGILTGKLFEYLGARRRIVVIGGPESSAVDDVLAATGAGTRVTTDAALRVEVLAAIAEHRRGETRRMVESASESYAAPMLAHRFSRLLDEVAAPCES
ncbi:MAG: glycosyltransferase [bacterium]|nr:glycosyltransferase [bacterium]